MSVKTKPTLVSDYLEWSILLRDKGVERIVAEYSGNGSHGGIDEIYFCKKGEYVDDPNGVNCVTEHDCKKVFPYISKELFLTITDSILNHILCDESVVNWQLDEGGYGRISIDLLNSKYKIQNNIYTVTSNSYTNLGSIIDSEN
jgi:hypothetical protein